MFCFYKNAKIKFWRIRVSCINFLSRFLLQVTCMTHIIRKTSKFFILTGNEFYENCKNCIFCKITHGLGNWWKINSGQKMCQVCIHPVGHSATKISHPLCTFPVSAGTFELPIKRLRCMIEISDNDKMCLKTKMMIPGFDRKRIGHFGRLAVQSVRVFY